MKKFLLGSILSIVIFGGFTWATVSRYEFARQIQQVQCSECYEAAGVMDEEQWTALVSSNRYGLEDVSYQNGPYYACVEAGVTQNIMQGFPKATSPFCAGRFCGNALIVGMDAGEVILSLMREDGMSDEIFPIQSILETQRARPFLSLEDLSVLRDASQRCGQGRCVVSSLEEFQILFDWWSQSGVSAPYSESKWGRIQVLLRRLGIDWSEISAYESLTQETLDDALASISKKFVCDEVQSMPDMDTDRDGVIDSKDLCPRTYDPFQYDRDGDGKGDVCDSDIDGDGKENMLGVVDAYGRIDQSKLLQSADREITVQIGKPITDLTVSPARIKAGDTVQINTESNDSIDYGDGLTGKEKNRVYTRPGRYAIRVGDQAVQVVVEGSQDIQAGRIVSELLEGGFEFGVTLGSESAEDTVQRTREGGSELVTTQTSVFIGAETIQDVQAISAIVMDEQGNEVGSYQSTIDGSSQELVSSMILGPIIVSSNESIEYTTQWVGAGSVRDVRYIERYLNGVLQERVYGDDVWQHVFPLLGTYELEQHIFFKDRTRTPHINTMTLLVDGDPAPIVQLNTPKTAQVGESFESSVDVIEGSFDQIVNWSWFVNGEFAQQGGIILETTPQRIGVLLVAGFGTDQYGQSIFLQQPVVINPQETCSEQGIYQCDMDQDGIVDVCDSDIDGDGKENPLGVLIGENANCEISEEIIDESVLRESIGRSDLDNCPFDSNPEQADSNEDGIGDVCEGLLEGELCFDQIDNDGDGDIDCEDEECSDIPVCTAQEGGAGDAESEGDGSTGSGDGTGGNGGGGGSNGSGSQGDADGDGIDDANDACPGVTGGGSGCPTLPDTTHGNGNGNGGLQIENPPCVSCPCPELDYIAQLREGDQVRALLYDESGSILYRHSQPYPVREEFE